MENSRPRLMYFSAKRSLELNKYKLKLSAASEKVLPTKPAITTSILTTRKPSLTSSKLLKQSFHQKKDSDSLDTCNFSQRVSLISTQKPPLISSGTQTFVENITYETVLREQKILGKEAKALQSDISELSSTIKLLKASILNKSAYFNKPYVELETFETN